MGAPRSQLGTAGEDPAPAGPLQLSKVDQLQRRIRILIDARKLGDGGIGRYIENIVCGLVKLKLDSVTLLVKSSEGLDDHWRNSVDFIVERAEPYSLDEYFGLPRRVDFSQFDIFHAPHFTLPYGISIPTVMTIHDLIHISHPERWYYPYLARPLIRSALRRATRVITVSNATFEAVNTLVAGNPRIVSKIRVVGNALGPEFADESSFANEADLNLAIKPGYLLTVASNFKPHKGLVDLLKAFLIVAQRMKAPRLVLAGQSFEELSKHSELYELVRGNSGIIVAGRVSKRSLVELYRNAAALVVASKIEGFCLPIIEAKAVGTRVLACPTKAVSDLLGQHDILCKDFSVESLAAGMEHMLISDRDTPPELAADVVDEFNVSTVVERVREVYLSALLSLSTRS